MDTIKTSSIRIPSTYTTRHNTAVVALSSDTLAGTSSSRAGGGGGGGAGRVPFGELAHGRRGDGVQQVGLKRLAGAEPKALGQPLRPHHLFDGAIPHQFVMQRQSRGENKQYTHTEVPLSRSISSREGSTAASRRTILPQVYLRS